MALCVRRISGQFYNVTEEVSIPVGHKHDDIYGSGISRKSIAGRKEINPETILNQNKSLTTLLKFFLYWLPVV